MAVLVVLALLEWWKPKSEAPPLSLITRRNAQQAGEISLMVPEPRRTVALSRLDCRLELSPRPRSQGGCTSNALQGNLLNHLLGNGPGESRRRSNLV